MKDNILEPNEQLLRLSLIHNAFDYLSIFDEYIHINHYSFKELKVIIISLMCFYESYFKWIIETNDGKKAIWDSKKPFNDHDYDIGNFHSINLDQCIIKMVGKKYLLSDEKDKIISLNGIRNRIVHFGFVGETDILGSYALLFDKNDLENQKVIISNLFQRTFTLMSSDVYRFYSDLIDKYKNVNC